MTIENFAVITLGIGMIALAFPNISHRIFARLFNEGFVTPKQVRPEDAEIIKYAGPNLSLLVLGAIIIIAGVVI